MGTGFSGGLGGTRQELCGALSGAVLVISVLWGRTELEEDDRTAMNLAALYRSRFLAKFGETQCAALRERLQARDGPNCCAILVENATALLLQIFQEMQAMADRPDIRVSIPGD
jgi:C_GCAxxG_C_C family probable redox protein